MSGEDDPGNLLLAGRYRLGHEIGVGSTAVVHRGHDRRTGEDVAIKLFTVGPSPAGDGRNRREVEILTGLRHPGLVGLRDAGTTDGRLFVVMDLVDGESLAAALRHEPLPPATVEVLGAELAEALAHVHARGIVHRDVKPANILLDADRRPRLTDFGIARLDGSTAVTRTGVVVGTAAYMAPEQVRGRAVSGPADIYALGLVLLEAVTGRREYPGAAVEAAIARLHRSPEIPARLPPRLREAVRRMTAADPADRPDATTVAAMLRGTPGPGHRPVAARYRLVPLAALAVLLGGAVSGVAMLQPDAAPTVAAAAPLPGSQPVPPVAPTVPAPTAPEADPVTPVLAFVPRPVADPPAPAPEVAAPPAPDTGDRAATDAPSGDEGEGKDEGGKEQGGKDKDKDKDKGDKDDKDDKGKDNKNDKGKDNKNDKADKGGDKGNKGGKDKEKGGKGDD